ncbi:MAG: glycosyltransferase [Dehalococcoidia bacterium]|nr:glycosyltransferase [Dehalococcoidia bacterium]
MDRELLAGLADVRPDSHFILIGPVVKMEPGSLPRSPNLHYLGPRAYADLPRYLAGWQAAMLPFARNDATRFISPTKIPEYLAAGLPVVSTSIPDVVSVFGRRGLVWIADSVHAFAASLDRALREDPGPRLQAVAAFLSKTSWDRTWAQMRGLLEDVLRARVRHEGRAISSWKAPRAAHEAGHV